MKRATQSELFAARPIKPVSSQARAMTAKRKAPTAPAPRPWKCSVLAVDTADNSGFSVWVDGTLVYSGEVETRDTALLNKIADWPSSHTISAGPPVLVLEAPWGGSTETVVGMAMARERWERAWRDAGEAMSRIVRVNPSTWRAAVLGNIRGLKREQIREMEGRVARALLDSPKRVIGEDEAAAVCIGRWSSYAPQIGQVIGKRAVKASLEAWTR